MTKDEQGPRRKRQRHSTEHQPSSCKRVLLEEVDLEVALRHRLASAVESRITWALVLQETLNRDLRHPADGIVNEYQHAALDTLGTIEKPCTPIFTRDIRRPQLRPVQIPVAAPPQVAPISLPSQSAYSTRNRGLPRATRPTPRKLLFVRNNAALPPQIAKLACPDCSRTDFSSLQGLLNHCRLSHKREFGSHDECVQCCALLVENPEDQALVVASGTEVGDITIPGLRRLFEIAVGGNRQVVPLLPHKKIDPPLSQPALPDGTTPPSPENHTDTPYPGPAHITQTLGYHADTPALASFLGRAPKQRRIHSYDEDLLVDIFASEGSTQNKLHWRMPYPHRNKARAALDVVVEPSALTAEPSVGQPPPPNFEVVPLPRAPVSRFHIMARVSIQDLSMWIPPERRAKSREEHTHRWRLQVTAPSYSLPLNSFLTKMTVRSMTHPSPSTLVEPITILEPPFVVTSTTDQPFLAQITFTWVGSEVLNPPRDVEHWVELDPLRSGNIVPGEEQVFDIGLDRATELSPADHDQRRPIPWDINNVEDISKAAQSKASAIHTRSQTNGDVLDYSVRLRSLLPRFPLTLRDFKSRLSGQIPYTLVTTPAQFRSLVYGRRKAIEWGRANALREAYQQLCLSEPRLDGQVDAVLTTGEVFEWLQKEDQFSRDSRHRAIESVQGASTGVVTTNAEPHKYHEEDYCRYCGLHVSHHPSAPPEAHQEVPGVGVDNVKMKPTVLDLAAVCSHFNSIGPPDLPVTDANRLLASSSSPDGAPRGLDSAPFISPSGENFSNALYDTADRDILAASNPKIVLAIGSLATYWKLDRLCENAPDPDGVTSSLRDDTGESGLASRATLALAVQSFTRMMMRSAVAEFRRDEAGLRALIHGSSRNHRRHTEAKRLLTPSHVVRGVLHDAPSVAGCRAVLLAMSPLGISLPSAPAAADETEGD